MNLQDISERETPSSMRFSDMTPLGVKAKSGKVKFLPSNAGTFSNTNNVTRIPISSGTAFLDGSCTALKFTINNTGGTPIQLDGSASSYIQRMRIISSSGKDLEDIRNYGYLCNMLADLQYGTHERFSKSYEGFGYAGCTTPHIAVQAGAAAVVGQDLFLGAPSEGNLGTAEPTIVNGQSLTVCIPILLSTIGITARKYFPLFLSSLMLEIEWANQYMPFVSATAVNSYSLTSVELHCQMVEFAGDVNTRLTAMCNAKGLYLHGTSWNSIYNAVPANDLNILVNDRLNSLKSVFACFSLPQADSTTRYMGRHHANATSFQVKIGSSFYPNQPISGNAYDKSQNSEYFLETLKAISEWQNVTHHSLLCPTTFALPIVYNDGLSNSLASCGRAVYGLDLDAFTRERIESGVDTINSNPMNIIMSRSSPVALNSFIFLLHDRIYSISPNGDVSASW